MNYPLWYGNFYDEYNKAEAGDEIVIKYTYGRSINYCGSGYVNIKKDQITDLKVIKKPFDWSTVKHGMAFNSGRELFIYIGKTAKGIPVFENLTMAYGCHSCQFNEVPIPHTTNFKRVPEHDINPGENK